jgi:hypothetical protein
VTLQLLRASQFRVGLSAAIFCSAALLKRISAYIPHANQISMTIVKKQLQTAKNLNDLNVKKFQKSISKFNVKNQFQNPKTYMTSMLNIFKINYKP